MINQVAPTTLGRENFNDPDPPHEPVPIGARTFLSANPANHLQPTLTPALSHPMGEGAERIARGEVRLYDAHLHLQLFPLKENAASILAELKKRKVRKIVVNGTREEDWDAVAKLADDHEMVIPAFGLHPWHAHEASDNWKKTLCRCLDRYPFCVGEIGLDKWIENPAIEKQQEAFLFQLREAKARNLPATIHCLKAWGLLLEILTAEAPFPRGFLLHSYGGSAEMIKPLADLGAYFSLSGYFAYPRKLKQQEAFKQVPLEKLLLETDAPDMLPPENLQTLQLKADGKDWNHPANIQTIYQFGAKLFGLSEHALAAQASVGPTHLYYSL